MPRVFTIPASVPFLPTLLRALRDGRLVPGFPTTADPLELATATLYLPTRRACRLARDVFLDVLGTEAAILPRILPIGDVDEDELVFAEAARGAAALDLPQALGGLERRLILARLVLKWAQAPGLRRPGHHPLVAQSPAAALALADALARLMDDMATREVDWRRLDGLVPDHVDRYWQLTLDFLRIARDTWPALLEEAGLVEPAVRRDRLIAAEVERLAAGTGGPVIAAGSTGSMPATAKLLAAIAKLPQGAVVLPGLDTDLDDESWSLIGGKRAADGRWIEPPAPVHPQYAMHGLLTRIGIAREAVTILEPAAPHGRERLVSEALRPAAATDRWRARTSASDFAAALDRGLAGVTVIEAPTAEEEAFAVAVALREAVETPHRTAALITPDRALARRVVAALERWRVPVDDSGGDPLADTPAGVFARLVVETATNGLPPVGLLALLKHARFRLGREAGGWDAGIAALERAVLRGPRPRAGSAGLLAALAALRASRDRLHPRDPRAALTEADLAEATALASALAEALRPLETVPDAPAPLRRLAACHRETLEALTAGDDDAGTAPDVEALTAVLADMVEGGSGSDLPLAPADYPEFFHTVLADRTVRRPGAPGARVRIFGPLEARLQNVDRVVLAGLVEGVWPPETRTDPWLSRAMRHDLGLDLPERRIGLSAHDLAQALGAPEAILTYPAKLGGAPTVVSRFIQRLAAVAGPEAWNAVRERGRRYLACARALDEPGGRPEPVAAPRPCPPRAARPAYLTVTEIEDLLRDPYTIYARHVLKLTPLEAVDAAPGAADRGSAMHAALGRFSQQYAEALPDDAAGALVAIGRAEFQALDDYPEARAFWWPRFVRVAHWFAAWERRRRAEIAATAAEIRGEIALPLGERVVRLAARADRIDRLRDGRYVLIDYKTGQARTEKQVRSGLAPQLTLEGAILRAGGFPGIAPGGSIAAMAYVLIKGGDPAGQECVITFKDSTPDTEADRALDRLRGVLARFEDEATPYRSLVSPMWSTGYGDYDHLARIKEWSVTGGAVDSGEAVS